MEQAVVINLKGGRVGVAHHQRIVWRGTDRTEARRVAEELTAAEARG